MMAWSSSNQQEPKPETVAHQELHRRGSPAPGSSVELLAKPLGSASQRARLIFPLRSCSQSLPKPKRFGLLDRGKKVPGRRVSSEDTGRPPEKSATFLARGPEKVAQ